MMIKDLNFKLFLEDKQDIKNTISKLPKDHIKLLNDLEIKYTCGNTLEFDEKHVGQIKNNKMIISAPWNYSRQFTTLHEIAHIVWCKILTKNKKEEWEKIVSKTKLKTKEKNTEELFCMAYANYYSSHKLLTYDYYKWKEFIKSL